MIRTSTETSLPPSVMASLSVTTATYTYDFIEFSVSRFPHRFLELLKTYYHFEQYGPYDSSKRIYRSYGRINGFRNPNTDLHVWWDPEPLTFMDPHKRIPKFAVKVVNRSEKLISSFFGDAFEFWMLLRAADIPERAVKVHSLELSTIINLPHEFVKKRLNIKFARRVTLEGPKNPHTIYFTNRGNQHGRIYCYPQRDADNNPEPAITKIDFEMRGKRRLEEHDLTSIEKIKNWNPLSMLRRRVEFLDVDFDQVAKRNSPHKTAHLKLLYRSMYVSSWLRHRLVKNTCPQPRKAYCNNMEELEKAYFGGVQSTLEIVKDLSL